MSGYGVRIGVGTRFSYDGEVVEIFEVLATPAGNEAVLKTLRDQSIRRMALRELLSSSNAQLIPDGPGPGADYAVDIAGVVLAQLSDLERAEVAARAELVREVLTGYKSGHSELPQPGEPRPELGVPGPIRLLVLRGLANSASARLPARGCRCASAPAR